MKEVTMGNIKRKLLVLLLMLAIGVTPVFANMPVIDFTAIAQAITSYMQTIQEWNAQVQQWKSEYDRIAKAAKGIASGEFSEIIKSIGSLASQVSGWELGKTLSNGKDLYFDNALSSIGDGSYSLLALMSNTDLLMANYDTFMEIFEENAFKNIEEKLKQIDAARSALRKTPLFHFKKRLNKRKELNALKRETLPTADVFQYLEYVAMQYEATERADLYQEFKDYCLQRQSFT